MADFFYGVIEGFYGRQWSWNDRIDYAPFLSDHGFDCYIYAPKGDLSLRSQWRQPLPSDLLRNLETLAQHYHSYNLRWGVGLSPLGLSEQFSGDDRRALVQRIGQINQLQADILCILFDDVRGDFPGLAQRQCEVVDVVLQHSNAAQHIVCPTYYSNDPVLEKVFGTMPEGYLADLGRGLHKDVGIFWTGEKVVSEEYREPDLKAVSSLFGRRPILWDNYPVNDGKSLCGHLHLRPYSGRPPLLRQWVDGHLVNPMNQPWLSRLVLQSLEGIYSTRAEGEDAWGRVRSLLGEDAFADQLTLDLPVFQDRGLDAMTDSQRCQLATIYRTFAHPAAAEIVDWLEGGYAFDPACLTG